MRLSAGPEIESRRIIKESFLIRDDDHQSHMKRSNKNGKASFQAKAFVQTF